MASATPGSRRLVSRPSLGGLAPPNLLERASTNMHRKASYNALVGSPATPTKKMVDVFEIGDVVNVPGDMYGTVKFVGSVRGKQGRFLGVQLDDEFADRGKNNGDVDGVSYFSASVPGSGIFLPLHRAERRFASRASTEDGVEDSPSTPKASAYQARLSAAAASGRPSVPKFAQTIGPGARPPSPQFKPNSRQSLPRPESPFRRVPNLQPQASRQFSQSVRPGSKPPLTPSAARSATPKFSASVRGGAPPRPYSRTGSRMGNRPGSVCESSDLGASIPLASRSPSRMNRAGEDVGSLQRQLANRDKQLEEQAQQLAEMELSLKEIQTLLPDAASPPSPRSPREGSVDAGAESIGGALELRRALREKNDKINSLIAEFDAHRADFRSTIETLEMASDETVRMYETRIQELLGEIETQRENNTSQKDFESIAAQIKMLEDLVAELEEGLEDARRDEAEARGEVEFLRGEVERGRSELKRERERAAKLAKVTTANGTSDKDRSDFDRHLEMKEDEIRGLKAILHSNQTKEQTNGHTSAQVKERKPSSTFSLDPDEMKRLQESLHKLELQNAELEAQLRWEQEGRRNDSSTSSNNVSNNGASNARAAVSSSAPTASQPSRLEPEALRSAVKMQASNLDEAKPVPIRAPAAQATSEATKDTKDEQVDDEKWCALCEQNGHLAFDCPNEQY